MLVALTTMKTKQDTSKPCYFFTASHPQQTSILLLPGSSSSSAGFATSICTAVKVNSLCMPTHDN